MRFEGRVDSDGKFWLAEIPALDASTQGRTKREALAMAGDLVETMAAVAGFEVTVHPGARGTFEIEANRTDVLVALLLRRQRKRHGLTLAEAAERLGQRSPNAYARYEQGVDSVAFAEKNGWLPPLDGEVFAYDDVPRMFEQYNEGKLGWFPVYAVNG